MSWPLARPPRRLALIAVSFVGIVALALVSPLLAMSGIRPGPDATPDASFAAVLPSPSVAVAIAVFGALVGLSGALVIRRRVRDRARLQLQHAERRLRESEAALADAQKIAHLGSWEYDVTEDTLTWSDETYHIFGVDRDSFPLSVSAVMARVHPLDHERVDRSRRESLLSPAEFAFDYRTVLDDDSVRHVQERGRTFGDSRGVVVGSIGTVQDITERKHAEEKLVFANTLLTTQMETSPDAMLVVDESGRITSSNRRFAEMWSLPAELLQSGDDKPVLAAVTSMMKNPAAFAARVQHLYQHPEQSVHEELETTDGRFIDRYTASLRSPSGQYLGRVWFFRDITDRKRAEVEIRHSATHDALTGLANRAMFMASVEQAIARSRRHKKSIALLCLDLDHFKDVNDTLGHPAGDLLLQMVAKRLRGACRAEDTVARFGGDEFAIIASDLAEPEHASILAASIIKVLGEPFMVHGHEVRTGASIGISTYLDGEGADSVLAHADVALYGAKAAGRGLYRFFNDTMDQEVRTRATLGAQLKEAIGSGQLFLLFQPLVNVHTGRMTGVEALVRWRHPDLGVLEPASFIPIAERSGLIATLSSWVLRESCRQAKAWLDAGFTPGSVAVNLSALQFKAPIEFETDVVAVLESTGLPAGHLELEITEQALMVASREGNDVLGRLRARGIRLSIDDFGTGYSSLDYLRRFPVDRIKIPQAFVSELSTLGGSTAIVRATIGLARELDIEVIAQGIQTEAEFELVERLGCQYVQGVFLSPPLTPDALAAILQQDRPLTPALSSAS
jgi:diguanylate cyclase (GGDEF)-like protein/PAS domain S-box-containing protein